MSRDHGTHFIETEALLELRQLIYAAFNLAEVGQEVERERSRQDPSHA